MTDALRYYVVSYDLRQPYTREDYIKIAMMLRTAPDFCRALWSFWIVGTPLRPSEIIDEFVNAGFIGPADRIVVLEMTGRGDFFGAQPVEIEEWLRTKIVVS